MDSKDQIYYFEKYLNSKGITIDEKYEDKKSKYINPDIIMNQLKLIVKFHNEVVGYREYNESNLPDEIGKTVEKFNVEMKKVKRILNNIKYEKPKNHFEKILLFNGDMYMERAKRALNIASGQKYINVINRSMKRGEICIGNPYFDNLFEKEGIIITNTNNCSYDLIEMDAIKFFRKIKAKGYKFDLDYFINEYCKLEALDSYSNEYIMSLLSYPYYFIKCCLRYKDKKKDWNETDYLDELIKARRYDGGI